MRAIVTCGPSYEPIDEVRRITNFSTGELGVMLANHLADAGVEVLCFRGAGATTPLQFAQSVPFTTNELLRDLLRALPDREQIGAVFHAAALCDFKIKRVSDAAGAELHGAKISSRANELHLTLEPAAKLIGELRELFPQSLIVGWKYELDGTRDEAIARGRNQLVANATDGCIVNGAAYGEGFGFMDAVGSVEHLADKQALCEFLTDWLV